VGVFCVAIGKGGELAYEQADHAPLDLGPVSATDVALLRPPTALWGYNMQVTDEALDTIARALRDRDIEIAFLQRQLSDLGHEVPSQLAGAERTPGFSPRHAAGQSSDDSADPWSRLWTSSETPLSETPLSETTDETSSAETTGADAAHADETAAIPAADDTAISTRQADPEEPSVQPEHDAEAPSHPEDVHDTENLTDATDPDDAVPATHDPNAEEQGW
jgi:hypothetical protein